MAQPSSGLIRFTNAGGSYVDIAPPVYPYQTIISMPLDIERLDTRLYSVYDHGSGYDRRWCRCTFELTAEQTSTLTAFLITTGATYGRAVELTLEMASDVRFFPFGPDQTPVGGFDVSVVLQPDQRFGDMPLGYGIIHAVIYKSDGAWPAYSLPTEVSEGGMTVGTVSGLRFPQEWFSPAVTYGYDVAHTQGAETLFVDRGSGRDAYETACKLTLNESKAAALINYLTGTARGSTFSLVTPAGSYAFGVDKADDGTYTVRLITGDLELVHEQYNMFTLPLNLSYESGPA